MAIMLIGSVVFGQTTVKGNVSDADGPLPGANVVVKGTTIGTTSDFDGFYTLENVPVDATLVFTFLGYVNQEITVAGQSEIDVILSQDANQLDEVIVVGYGTQSRAEVTGAISTVDADEIVAVPVTNAEQALQGRAAGVTVVNNGSPGTAPTVRIRGLGTMGSNNPLYVIDGVITGGLGNLNPNDIESMNVLKDASTTAIYGALGANGVVMVTTKRGRSGATKITFDSYIGSQWTDERYDLLNSDQYLAYASEAFNVVPSSEASRSDTDTNWQDEIFQSGLIQDYNLGISGGGDNSNYRISGGYQDQVGTVIDTGFKRYSFRANSDFTLGKVTFGEAVSISSQNQNPERAGGGRSLIEHSIKMAPYLTVRNPDNLGGYQGPSNSLDGQDAENPVRVQSLGDASNRSVSILGSAYGQWEIIEGLKFKSQVGLDYVNFNNDSFVPSYNDDSETFATNTQNFAQIVKNTGTVSTVTWTNSLAYKTTISDKHNLDALLLMDWFDRKGENINTSSQNNITDEVDQVSLNGASLTSTSFELKRISYLGRVNYNFDERYLVALSLRYDASSKFGANERWGFFPSLGLGWNISNEAFMEDSNVVSNLKLRGSWGLVGNDNIANYLYSATLGSNFFYPINGAAAVGTTASGVPNPNLKWEETTMINVGVDVGFLNESVRASFEYYVNSSDDLLMGVPLPTSLGFDNNVFTSNVGSVDTQGFEMTAGYQDTKGEFTWSVDFNLGTSSNEVKSLGGISQIPGANFENENISNTTEGESLFYFYGLEMDGIYQTQAEVDAVFTQDPSQTTVQPGDIRYIDHNEDGTITSADRVKIGDPYASLTYGLNLAANWKNLDFSLFFNGISGNDVYNTNIYDLEGMPRLFNAGKSVVNRWTGPGTSNTVPRAGGAPQNLNVSSRFVEDGSYTKLRNVTVGYNLSGLFASETISKFRVYVSGQNLAVISSYSGLDPEVGASSVINNNINEFGIDRGNYPQPKSFLFGVQLQF